MKEFGASCRALFYLLEKIMFIFEYKI